MHFLPTSTGVRAAPDDVEVAVLRSFAQDLLTLLADEEDETAPADPLEALLGLPAGQDHEVPADPALARLFPDAYPDDDPDASREFRRYTEGDLRAGKRENCTTVLATLPTSGELTLDRDQADAWLGFLNDLRLVIGVRLAVTDDPDDGDPDDGDPDDGDPDEHDPDEDDPDDDDPDDDDPDDDDPDDDEADDGDPDEARTHALAVYRWLSRLQESLLSCLTPRH